MMRKKTASFCLVAMLSFDLQAADLVDIIARIKPSIVAVGTVEKLRSPTAVIRGTGFAVGNGKYVLTNAHVVDGEVEAESGEQLAVFGGGAEEPEVHMAEVVAQDKEHDMALLSISGTPLPALVMGDATKVREGEQYAFTGFPLGMMLGLYPVTHRAGISAITPIAVPANSGHELTALQIMQLRKSYKVFQLDATAYPGNSGSPLFDPSNGRVIGVINKVFVQESKEHAIDRPSGISYAMPIEYGKALLQKVDQK